MPDYRLAAEAEHDLLEIGRYTARTWSVGGGQKESQNGGHGRAGSCEMASRSQGDAPVCEAAFRSTYDVDAERLARAAR
jgi:hypothetical protein